MLLSLASQLQSLRFSAPFSMNIFMVHLDFKNCFHLDIQNWFH